CRTRPISSAVLESRAMCVWMASSRRALSACSLAHGLDGKGACRSNQARSAVVTGPILSQWRSPNLSVGGRDDSLVSCSIRGRGIAALRARGSLITPYPDHLGELDFTESVAQAASSPERVSPREADETRLGR